jgi:hypothetical protein
MNEREGGQKIEKVFWKTLFVHKTWSWSYFDKLENIFQIV